MNELLRAAADKAKSHDKVYLINTSESDFTQTAIYIGMELTRRIYLLP